MFGVCRGVSVGRLGAGRVLLEVGLATGGGSGREECVLEAGGWLGGCLGGCGMAVAECVLEAVGPLRKHKAIGNTMETQWEHNGNTMETQWKQRYGSEGTNGGQGSGS